MYIYIYIYIHTNKNIYTCRERAWKKTVCVYIYIYIYIYICVCLCVSIYLSIYLSIYENKYLYISIYRKIYVHVSMWFFFTCICVCIYIFLIGRFSSLCKFQVWILSFHFPRLIAIPQFKSPICPPILQCLRKNWDLKFVAVSTMITIIPQVLPDQYILRFHNKGFINCAQTPCR